jgi:hypothetical protein
LTRTQLYSLRVQMRAILADLPEGSVEHQFVLATLENVRQVVPWASLSL